MVHANDELFAERENLIKPEAPAYSTYTFGHKGQVYDGWETRRRREPGHDHAVVRLGAAGVVRGVVVDTAFFKGNYPPEVSVEGTGVEGYPSAAELQEAEWVPLVRSLAGEGRHPEPVPGPRAPALHPRAAVDVPRRRGGPAARPRRGRRPTRASCPSPPSTWPPWPTGAW